MVYGPKITVIEQPNLISLVQISFNLVHCTAAFLFSEKTNIFFPLKFQIEETQLKMRIRNKKEQRSKTSQHC